MSINRRGIKPPDYSLYTMAFYLAEDIKHGLLSPIHVHLPIKDYMDIHDAFHVVESVYFCLKDDILPFLKLRDDNYQLYKDAKEKEMEKQPRNSMDDEKRDEAVPECEKSDINTLDIKPCLRIISEAKGIIDPWVFSCKEEDYRWLSDKMSDTYGDHYDIVDRDHPYGPEDVDDENFHLPDFHSFYERIKRVYSLLDKLNYELIQFEKKKGEKNDE